MTEAEGLVAAYGGNIEVKGVQCEVKITEFLEGEAKKFRAKGFTVALPSEVGFDNDAAEDALASLLADQFPICNEFSFRG